MEASRFCDAFGSLTGHNIMQAYAEQSYTQAELNSKNATWINVPPIMRKDGWVPDVLYVMPLIKALDGHPQSGATWENKYEQAICDDGFERIGRCGEWRSC